MMDDENQMDEAPLEQPEPEDAPEGVLPEPEPEAPLDSEMTMVDAPSAPEPEPEPVEPMVAPEPEPEPEIPPEYVTPMTAEAAAAMGAGPEADMDPEPPAMAAAPPPASAPPPPPVAPPPAPSAPSPPLSPEEARNWAMFSHLSALLALLSAGLLGPVAAGLIWLIYKDRSEFVKQQSAQSFWFQIASLILLAIFWVITAVLSFITFGLATFCLVPIGILLTIVPLVWPMVAAYQVAQGANFRYPLLADMVGIPKNG